MFLAQRMAGQFALTLGLLSAGCLMKEVDTNPRAPVQLPEGGAKGQGVDPGPWWNSFNDPELSSLVDRALKHNFQLKMAWARLEQAKALEGMAGAGLFPHIGANASVSHSKSPPRVFSLGGSEQTIPGVESTSYNASIPVSYELDVWGRVRAGKFAAEQDRIAMRAEAESAAMTVAANVTERWLDIIEQRVSARLLREQLEINQLNLELVRLRFTNNDAALSEVYQQQQQVQGIEAQLTGVEGQQRVAENHLSALVGIAPARLLKSPREKLPMPPPLPAGGIAASILERRPDLRAAKARVVAADYRIAQAIAARLPNLTLSGSLGFSATELSKFFESFVWSVTGAVSGTIWDGGRLGGDIDRTKAVLTERVAAYGQALLTALVEVESALILERQARARIAVLERQEKTARMTVDAARSRFQAGLGSYLATLTALRSLQQAEQSLLSAKRQMLSQRVQVYRALGSNWAARLEAPADKEDS